MEVFVAIVERDLTGWVTDRIVIFSATKFCVLDKEREQGEISSKDELLWIEGKIEGVTYTYEKSSLGVISYNFPELEGKTFLSWIDFKEKKGEVKILEIGGGVVQAAAIETLRTRPNIFYTAFEPRPLEKEAKERLDQHLNYRHIGAGVSTLGEKLNGERFDIIFAHHVVEHLPNPYSFIEQACNLLGPEGIFFCNELPINEGRVKDFITFIKKQGASVAYFYTNNEGREFKRQGIRQIKLAIRTNGADLVLPVQERITAEKFGDFRLVESEFYLSR